MRIDQTLANNPVHTAEYLSCLLKTASYQIENSPLINSTLATYQSQCTVRNTNVVWVYKTVNEKKYKRLYNIETGQWIGDWIPA